MNLLFIPLTIGLPAIDESLEKLLTAMETFPNVAVLGDAVSMAKALGLCLALCVGSYECWMMMLGRRGMDVMKLLRIIGISLCISSSSWICSALQVPGKSLESATWAMAKAKNKDFSDEFKILNNTQNIMGIEGEYKETPIIEGTFNFEGKDYTSTFSVFNATNAVVHIEEETGVQIHGILGIQFLIENKWVINFDKNIIKL